MKKGGGPGEEVGDWFRRCWFWSRRLFSEGDDCRYRGTSRRAVRFLVSEVPLYAIAGVNAEGASEDRGEWVGVRWWVVLTCGLGEVRLNRKPLHVSKLKNRPTSRDEERGI